MATNPPITIGELTDVPAPGAGVKSAWCQEITNRIHHRFSTSAARAAAFSAPQRAQASYLTTGDINEGPEWFNGTAWRKPWNQAWGYIAAVVRTTDMGPIGAADLPGMVLGPLTLVPNRRLKVTVSLYGAEQIGAGVCELWIADTANNRLDSVIVSRAAGAKESGVAKTWLTVSTAAALTLKLRNSTSAGTPTAIFYANTVANGLFMVEDIGPAGAPA